MKSNKFQLNTVYSALVFDLMAGESYAKSWRFYANLYNDHPQYCPWPKAMQMWKEHCEKYATNAYAYFVPVKRTACYLTLSISGLYTQRFLIKTDENGLEYIMFNNIALYAYDIDELTVEEANKKYFNLFKERELSRSYVDKLMHLEKFGYIYVAGGYGEDAKRVTTIEELDAAWKNRIA